MSIKNISKLKDFGVFKDYTNVGVQDFGKFNLFYGWNGSGKSTLSYLFRCIENKSITAEFPSATFVVSLEDGTEIKPINIGDTNLSIYTFDENFVKDNISWNRVLKGILLVDKEKISERKELEKEKETQEVDTKTYNDENKKIQKLEASIARFGTDSARHIKTSLQLIDTSDRYYMNYDKRKFESLADENFEVMKSSETLLDDQMIIDLTSAAKPDKKSAININKHILIEETFLKAKIQLDDLLKTSIISKTIKRLVDHNDISKWIETGLDLYKRYNPDQCEFCGSVITEERIKQLESHFNDNYKDFQGRLEKADQWLLEKYIQQPQLPSVSDFYDEFKMEYKKACDKLDEAREDLNDKIENWHSTLKIKIKNPLELGLSVNSIAAESIIAYNDTYCAIEAVVGKHNYKTINFQEEINKVKKRLELHYAASEIMSFGYYDKKKEIDERSIIKDNLQKAIEKRKVKIRHLEDLLSNESLGAEQFNNSLHKFLGRSELSLRFNSEKKGYQIFRNNSDVVGEKLSEGEKTAIAFVYFITKLKENDNKLEDTIVVIDDPVSSFDSNHIFHAYSFLRSNCNMAKQLFILTHNFTYFKLIRDWFFGVNKNRIKKNKPKDPIAFFYIVEASTNLPREAAIKNADNSLVNYNSEVSIHRGPPSVAL